VAATAAEPVVGRVVTAVEPAEEEVVAAEQV